MIKDNFFYLDKVKTVVFIGFSPIFDKLIKINSDNKIKSIIVTSSSQSKKINNKIKFKIFDKFDNRFINFIKKNTDSKETLFFSVGSRIIFNKESIKNVFSNNLINTHGTRLPLGRGEVASWRILKQDRLDNQLFHVVDGGIDTGEIIFNKLSIIPKAYQTPDEIQKFRNINFENFYKSFLLKILKKDRFKLCVQQNYLSSYLPRLSSEKNGWIDWSMDPHELIRFINAFDEPYIGACSFINRSNLGRLHIKSAQLHGGEVINHSFMSGIVIRHDTNWIVVSTSSKYSLLIEKVLNARGKNILNQIKVGDRFYTPSNVLENAKKYRAFFNSKS